MADNIVEVTLKLVDKFTAPMTEAVKFFESSAQQIVQASKELSDKYDGISTSISAVTGKIKDMKDFTKSVEDTAKEFDNIKNIGKIGNNFLKFGDLGKAAFVKVNSGYKGMAEQAKIAIGLIKNPTFQIIAVIAILAVAVYLIIKNWSKVKPFFINLGESLKNTFLKMRKAVLDWYNENKDLIKRIAIVLTGVLAPSLMMTANKAADAGYKIVTTFGKSLIASGKEAIKSAARISITFVKSLISAGIQSIKTGAQIIAGLVNSFARYVAMGWKAVAVGIKNIWVFQGQRTAMIAYKAVTNAVKTAQLALNASFLASPVFWIVAGIVAAVIAGYLLIKNWKTVKKTASIVWTEIKSVFGGIGKFLTSVFQGVESTFKGFINAIISGLNRIPQGLNSLSFKVPSWVPKIGGQKLGFNLPTIPYLAHGTSSWPGGLAVTQERGGEIMDLPRGTRVYPHDKSLQMARAEGARNKGNVYITINKLSDNMVVRSDSDIDKFADALASKLEKISNNTGRLVTE